MKKLVCLGDSITDADRLFTENGYGRGYVSLMDEVLNAQTKTFEIINRGVDGFTVDRLAQNVRRDCIDWQPDIVTVLIGINDVGILMNTNRTASQQQELLAKFGRLYRYLLEQIRQYTDSKVILMEPFIFPYPREYVNWIPYVHHISGQIGDLATEFDCPYVLLHDRLNEAAAAEGYEALTVDGIHLTQRGHRLLAEQLLRELK